MSFLTAVMGKELSFDSLIPCTAIGTILNTCALLRLTKIICNRCIEDNDNNFIAEIAICLFAAFNGFLFIDPFGGFYPMTLGSAFYVHALAEILNVFWTKKFKKSNIIWGTAYICCLAITYSELIPFLTLHILCLMGYACYKERKIWNSIIQYIFSLAIFSIVFLNVYVGDVIKAVLMEMQDRVGSERKFGFLEYLGYIFGTLPSDYSFHRVENPFCKLVYLCLTLIVSVWIIFLIKKYMKKDCRVELGYLYLPFIVLLFYFNFFAPNLWEVGTGNSYSVYKSMRYFILVLLPVIAMLINQFYYQNGIRKKIVKIYLLVIILIGSKNISYHYNALRIGNAELLGNFEDNFGEYYELRERYKFEGKIINLVDLPEAHSRLVSYFLKECRLAWPYKNDIFHHRYVEKEPKCDKEGITLLYDPDNPEAIAGLREIASDYCKISLDDGFYAEEILIDGAYEGNSFCWSESQSCVTVSRPIDYDACVKICFDVIPHNPYQKAQLHIYDKDSRRKIKDIDIEPMLDESGEVKAVPIELNLEMEGALERELQIEYDGLVYDGERELAYLILLDDNIEYRSTEY